MIEKVFRFGQFGNLVGIITEPDKQLKAEIRPCVILLNAGLVHRVGPARLNVQLARRLAFLGYTVFRFDLSGIGDSEIYKEGLSYQERAVGDIQEAMNFLSVYQSLNKFVLIGLCTGADNAHRTAIDDERVCGLVLLDGYAYPTLGYYIRYYGPRLLNFSVWFRLYKRLVVKFFSKGKVEQPSSLQMEDFYFWKLPPKSKLKEELETLIKRGVSMHYIFTHEWSDIYVYKNQFKDALNGLDFKNKLYVSYFPDANHTYKKLNVREKLFNTICEWINKIPTS